MTTCLPEKLGHASARFGTGVPVSTEQALRVSQSLHHALQKYCRIIKIANSCAHRPVKNRDGGPIAGVAYTNGGGASRQLGPDDNDPVSATQIPEASNRTIPLPPHNPSITFTFSFITHHKCYSQRAIHLSNYPYRHHFQYCHHL